MSTKADKVKDHDSRQPTNDVAQQSSDGSALFHFEDNRQNTVVQSKLHLAINNNPYTNQFSQLQHVADNSTQVLQAISFQAQANEKASSTNPASIHKTAASGIQGTGNKLPYLNKIQKSFGSHNIRGVQSYTGTKASTASRAIGAEAYTMNHKVAFANSTPTLHTTAHEAAHTIQQQAGVQLKDGLGNVGDQYERHADAVADRVVQGQSAESLLSQFAPPTARSTGAAANVQQRDNKFVAGVSAIQTKPHSRYLSNRPALQLLDSQLDGPPRDKLPAGQGVNTAYPGHTVNLPGGGAITNTANGPARIRTAGENLSAMGSNPAVPDHMDDYKKTKDWKRTGGLLHDISFANHTATMMHALNHHLDPGALNKPVQQNIFIGTKVSNNPQHLNLVERPIIGSIGDLATYNRYAGDNNAYEAQMVAAGTQRVNVIGFNAGPATYWPGLLPGGGGGNANIDPGAVKHASLIRVAADNTNYAKGVDSHPAGAPPAGYNEIGYALRLNQDTANNNYLHAWVDYSVTPNHQGIPSYIIDNIKYETDHLGGAGGVLPNDAAIAASLIADPARLGRALRTLMLPTPIVDVVLIIAEALAANAANAATTIQAMELIPAAKIVQHLPVAGTNLLIAALPGLGAVSKSNLFDALPIGYRRRFTAAGHVAPVGAAVVGGGAAVADPALPSGAAAAAMSIAEAATVLEEIMTHDIATAAGMLRLYPAADARQILAAATGGNALNPLLAEIPTDHAAQIVDNIRANISAAAAEAAIVGFGASQKGQILRRLPFASSFPIIHATAGAANQGAIIRNLPADYATHMIDTIRANTSAAAAANVIQQMTIPSVAIILEKLPILRASPILASLVGISVPYTARVIEFLPANHAAQFINDIRANVGALQAGNVLRAISASIIRQDIFDALPVINASAIITAVRGANVQHAAEMLDELRTEYSADVIHTIGVGNAAHAWTILNEMRTKCSTIYLLPFDRARAILATANHVDRGEVFSNTFNNYVAHLINYYINNAADAGTVASAMPHMVIHRRAQLYDLLPAAIRVPITGAGFAVPGGLGPVPLALPALAVVPRPPAIVIAAPNVAPAGLPAGGPPAGVPAVAPAAIPAAVAPAAAIPGTAIIGGGGGGGNLAGITTNVLGQVPAADKLRMMGSLGPDAPAVAGGMPNVSNNDKSARFRVEKLGSFPAWAREACPTSFTVDVRYYTASYNPNHIYDMFQAQEVYSTDLT